MNDLQPITKPKEVWDFFQARIKEGQAMQKDVHFCHDLYANPNGDIVDPDFVDENQRV